MQATNSLTFNITRILTGYFKNSYTWQALGVPSGSTVTQVSGSWWDKTSSSSSSGCSSSTTAGMQIFDSANTTEATSAALASNVVVDVDTAGATHSGGTVDVNAAYQAAATTVTLRFNLNPSAEGNFGSSTCNFYGDNYALTITYTGTAGRRGQVIIGWNRETGGTFGHGRVLDIGATKEGAITPISPSLLPGRQPLG